MRDLFYVEFARINVINFIDTICHVIIFVIEKFNYFLEMPVRCLVSTSTVDMLQN